MPDRPSEIEKFDQVASEYSELHAQTMRLSGEPVGYFAQYKIDRVKRLGVPSSAVVLDYGCGIGNLTELLVKEFSTVVGFDPSTASLDVARQKVPDVEFFDDPNQLTDAIFDVAIFAGVLHHVPVDERVSVLGIALTKLKPGGMAIIFEHNPYNPLTRNAVDKCAFDDDAILLKPREVRDVLNNAGYSQVRQDYIVFFPRLLAFFRPVEPTLHRFPLGAQTMTVGVRGGQ
jgi:2-polyprenyl-3-methyl-5-hydroxy-6-metoxy-1,4-benzoquinol methylase